ncbi:hypothetical protein CPB83DRAFT_843917 [Crepidotus variabilis]|uniref:Uncharacterized protein n=1 Tax=Crepidotus variabilis TaxID=179855 RepID=A0A9P6JUG3_9AGAR|nr:hypothetical protein CPB83DRAFT_843917 [Crepidotus variabilis]
MMSQSLLLTLALTLFLEFLSFLVSLCFARLHVHGVFVVADICFCFCFCLPMLVLVLVLLNHSAQFMTLIDLLRDIPSLHTPHPLLSHTVSHLH